MRVAYLNMIKPNGTCPCGLRSYFFQTLVIHLVINLILEIVVVISSFPLLLISTIIKHVCMLEVTSKKKLMVFTIFIMDFFHLKGLTLMVFYYLW